MKVKTGLDRLIADSSLQDLIRGKIGLLCHSASTTSECTPILYPMLQLFSKRLIKVFGPQHGFVSDVQDNMIESDHTTHPYFKVPIYSLYSETRTPTPQMLESIETMVIDLQDVGTRVYTYISTIAKTLEACSKKGIKVVVLDRPNPIGGLVTEGTLLKPGYQSFVGHHEIPQRHSLTIGEIAIFTKKSLQLNLDLKVIKMTGWTRAMSMKDTGLPWINPSPNLSTYDSAFTFVATVMFEGTKLSEGRGTTRALEMIGHPKLQPHQFLDSLKKELSHYQIDRGIKLRPMSYLPTFQKHAGEAVGGIFIHIIDSKKARPWKLGQYLMQKLYHYLKDDFSWNEDRYEYETEHLPIDYINGSKEIRLWIENNWPYTDLMAMEERDLKKFDSQKKDILLY